MKNLIMIKFVILMLIVSTSCVSFKKGNVIDSNDEPLPKVTPELEKMWVPTVKAATEMAINDGEYQDGYVINCYGSGCSDYFHNEENIKLYHDIRKNYSVKRGYKDEYWVLPNSIPVPPPPPNNIKE